MADEDGRTAGKDLDEESVPDELPGLNSLAEPKEVQGDELDQRILPGADDEPTGPALANLM